MDQKGKNQNSHAMRVFYVNMEENIGGAEQSLLLLIRFVANVVKVSVACPPGALSEKLKDLNVKTYKISSAPRKYNFTLIWFFYLVFVNLQLTLITFKVKPQIIHVNNCKAVLATVLSRIIAGKKLIWHARDLRYSKLLSRFCCRFSSKIIAVSKTVKDRLVNLGVNSELIDVIYNGVAPDERPANIKKESHNGIFTFANVGQFVPWKKQLLFIEAAERFLTESSIQANFILIGDDIFGRDDRYKKQLINKVKVSPFASNIKTIGWQEDMEPYWSRIDGLIHTTDTEPFGRVIIEAMMHKVSVIAAASCGPAEIIVNGKTGFLFRPDDVTDLVWQMKIIVEKRELANKLAENGRLHVNSNFQAEQTAGKILQTYKKLLAA